MKVGIAIDPWKLSIFDRRLRAAGYTFMPPTPFSAGGSLLLTISTDNIEALWAVVRAARDECRATGPKGAGHEQS
jgi:hypothetical protein